MAQTQANGRHQLATLEEQAETLRQELRRLEQGLPEPRRTPEQLLAREALLAAAIPFTPLYEAIAFADEVPPAAAGRLEQALTEMGLLDALVVSESDRSAAIALLQARGLSERLLVPAAGLWLSTEPLADLLRPDSAYPLAAAAMLEPLPPAVAVPAAIRADGTWWHGLLEGVTAPGGEPRFVGRAARERFRLTEIARLKREIADAEEAVEKQEAALKRLAEREAGMREEWHKLEHLPALDLLHTRCLELEHRRSLVGQEQKALEIARTQTAAARSAWDQQEALLQAEYRSFPAAAGLTRDGVQTLATATRNTRAAFDQVYHHAHTLVLHQEALDMVDSQLRMESSRMEEKEAEADDLAVAIRGLEGRRRGLQQVMERPDAQAILRRVATIRTQMAELENRRREADRSDAVAQRDVTRLEGELPDLHARATEAGVAASTARARLQEAVEAYPSLQSHAAALAAAEGARKVARSLLSRFEDRPGLAEDIQALEIQDRSALSKVFEERRSVLRPFYPEHHPTERSSRLVLFALDGLPSTPAGLLQYLQGQAEVLRTVLQRHEADLFERHLLQDVGREVRRCMLKARDWVADINGMLEDHPLRNDERVILDWEPKRTEHELGGLIARHANLLWIEESDLTPAQRDTLKSAFQEEIRQVREQARRGEWRADVFTEKLGEVLDYRNWFRFRIFVRGAVGGRTEITDTVYNARSGSERALVLLFPLIAGLSVRYDAAAMDAPRLLALDEGFAGIDAVNSRQLIRFLVALRLTWVVSSEKPPALTEDLPGASLYSMLREGTVVAARPFFWDGHRVLDGEAGWEEDNA